MPLTHAQKQERIDALATELKAASTIILTSFQGLTVAQDFQLRQQLRAVGARFQVLKNTLAERAAAATPAATMLSGLHGVSAVAYTSGDPVALARTLQKYLKDNPALQVKAGVVEGSTITAAEVDQLAATPAKEELYAKLLFLIQAPAQRLVTVLQATGRNTAVVLEQGVQQKKFAE